MRDFQEAMHSVGMRLRLLSFFLPAASMAALPPLPTRVNLPCVGLVASPTRELLVVGTAHTPCRSGAEATAVITAAKPDVVVIELDQERLERLIRADDDLDQQQQAQY